MRNLDAYPFEVRPLTVEEGGGFLVSYPDFSECVSDGETPEEAIANGREALMETIAALEEKGLPVPAPNSGGIASGSARRLDRSDTPGPDHRFTDSKSGRDSLRRNGGTAKRPLSPAAMGTIVHLSVDKCGRQQLVGVEFQRATPQGRLGDVMHLFAFLFIRRLDDQSGPFERTQHAS